MHISKLSYLWSLKFIHFESSAVLICIDLYFAIVWARIITQNTESQSVISILSKILENDDIDFHELFYTEYRQVQGSQMKRSFWFRTE